MMFNIICTIIIILLIVGFISVLRQTYKDLKYRDKLYDDILNCTSPEEWIVLKGKVIDKITKDFKPRYVATETTGSLYGALATKAEEFFKSQKQN